MSNNVNEVTKTVTLKTWDRSNRITIDHTYQGTPSIRFDLQRITTDGDKVVNAIPLGHMDAVFDPAADFPYLNPTDDSVIPGMAFVMLPKHTQVQVIIYSLYKSLLRR